MEEESKTTQNYNWKDEKLPAKIEDWLQKDWTEFKEFVKLYRLWFKSCLTKRRIEVNRCVDSNADKCPEQLTHVQTETDLETQKQTAMQTRF